MRKSDQDECQDHFKIVFLLQNYKPYEKTDFNDHGFSQRTALLQNS